MIINTGLLNVSTVRSVDHSRLTDFVKSDQHRVAMTTDIAKAVGLRPEISVKVDSGQELQALTDKSGKLTPEKRLALEKAAITFGSSTLPILKKYFPIISREIDGVEVVFASKIAFDAWADPERTNVVKPVIKTTRALFELLDVAQVVIPSINQVPYLGAVGVFVKVGDSVYQLWTEVTSIVGSPPKSS
jgi:hypothetical protein